MSTFKSFIGLKIDTDGNIERRVGHVPFAVTQPPVSASVRPDIPPREAARLLRRLADAIEEQQP